VDKNAYEKMNQEMLNAYLEDENNTDDNEDTEESEDEKQEIVDTGNSFNGDIRQF